MAKVHTLDIYPHTGDRYCLGCIDSEEVGAEEETARKKGARDEPARKSGPSKARGDTHPAGAVARVDPSAHTMLVGAAWDRSTAKPGEEVGLAVQALGIASGAPASFRVLSRDSERVVAELSASVSGGAASTRWTPEEPADDAGGELFFEVESEGHEARSGVLTLTDFIDVTVRDESDRPVAGAEITLRLSGGSEHRGRTDGDGHLRMDDTVPGAFTFQALQATPAASDDDTADGGDFDDGYEFSPGRTGQTGRRILLVYRRVDGSVQAESLLAAARDGTPFCEECARDAEERQEAAAQEGAPEPT